ncbi:DUF1835 domain-containing protein [Bacillus tianshenii]|uniref:DUF1835 domain-containing protein n=1 Tax=Sutcliffiella tianshenii TaxID=1463404 RepID=UPI001CD6289C|nr:DUF1835 domain-containing protein [Bacillus tianshenii]MCA1322385.1 DUF1835 domain-containing protein [Bacillus tianshenii]
MHQKIRDSIEQLSGSEAREFLYLAMARLDVLHLSDVPKEEIMEEINHIIQDCSSLLPPPRKDFHTVHIVSGDSAAGSLRFGLEREHKVIGFQEFFAMGPLWKLEEKKGRKERYEWLRDHINLDDYMEVEYESRLAKVMEEIRAIPEGMPIVLWTADNAGEQVFFRYILHLLQDKENEIRLINTSLAYKQLYDTADTFHFLRHTAEAHPEKLKEILEEKGSSPLSDEEIRLFVKEWLELSNTTEVLRIWEEDRIKCVPEDYYDELLLYHAREAQKENGKDTFIKSARIIGEMYGQLDALVNDSFLEYRLRTFVYSGILEIKGIPKAMRNYSVRVKQ